MAKAKFYAVVKGRQPGIFNRWDGGAREQVDNYRGAVHRSFVTEALALEWYAQNYDGPDTLHSPVFHYAREEAGGTPKAGPTQLDLGGKSQGRYTVYAIIDPRTDDPIYVGQTVNFERRKEQHLANAEKGHPRRISWRMAEILHRGDQPAFKVVQRCDTDEEALQAESAWVKRYTERGLDLCNNTQEHLQVQELYAPVELTEDPGPPW
ncbi:ribonuclease H1 domain-containing protein [Geopseudomonas aromaticivorans]